MKRYFEFILIFIGLTVVVGVHGQPIPEEWHGVWGGEVEIWSYNNKMDAFPMSLAILPKDTICDYIITYKKDPEKPDIRRYQLITIDQSKQHLAVDEQNSIVLDCYLNDNCLYTRFAGMGSDLQMRACLVGEEMEYEIISSFAAPIRKSGNEVVETDTIPEIKSFDVYHIMKARLVREK